MLDGDMPDRKKKNGSKKERWEFRWVAGGYTVRVRKGGLITKMAFAQRNEGRDGVRRGPCEYLGKDISWRKQQQVQRPRGKKEQPWWVHGTAGKLMEGEWNESK